jgi:opacity protein-like surface antigen
MWGRYFIFERFSTLNVIIAFFIFLKRRNRRIKMKKIALAACVLFVSLSAFAQLNPYVAIRGGYEKTKEDAVLTGAPQRLTYTLFDTNIPTFTLALGAELSEMWRSEVAYTYKTKKTDIIDRRDSMGLPTPPQKERLTQQTILANLFFYPFKDMQVKPFVGAGLGLGIVDMEYFGSDSNFAYAIYLGADYKFLEHWAVELMATYNSILSPYGGGSKDVYNFGGTIGLRYNF